MSWMLKISQTILRNGGRNIFRGPGLPVGVRALGGSSMGMDTFEREFTKLARKTTANNIERGLPSELLEFEGKKEQVVKFLEMLTMHGIQYQAGIDIILKCPSVLDAPHQDFINIISSLRCLGYKEEHRNKLLRKYPRIFELTKQELSNRIGFLNTYFESVAESFKVVLNSIEALTDHEDILRQKLRYLIIRVSHATSSIKNCSVLSYPLSHIKLRHEFLIKAGLFKPIPYRKLDKIRKQEKLSKTPRQKYFRPDIVVCTGDRDFLKICTKNVFTANDLAAFEEVYASNQDEDEEEYSEILLQEGLDEDSADEEDADAANSAGFRNKAEGANFYF